MAFSFWRSTASRWCLLNSSRTCVSIFCLTLISSTLRCSSTSSRRSRSATSTSTSSEARSSDDRSTVAAVMSPSRAGSLFWSRICAASSGMSGEMEISCLATS